MPVSLKVTRKGQVTIPKKFREMLGIGEGDLIYTEIEGDRIVLWKPGLPEPGEAVGEEEYLKILSDLEEERARWR
ncbi:MAG: AbrB/MazE/SpoVT family DNA-binding domain-containing protein [Candidatus Korarchaeota archaeon]|nr:AbrB/MazE/SpoVT family DNA-binding domain-containing protein [Candidatus Korarchaeota archaeon]